MFKSKIINWTLGIFAALILLGMVLPKPPETKTPESKPVETASEKAVPASEPAEPEPPKEPETHWRYENDQDEMGRKRAFAANTSTNTLSFKFPYGGEQHSTILLRKNHQGLDVIFSVEKGQFICDISDGCALNVKFDDGPITRFSASGPSDHSTTVLFIQNESRFVNNLKKAKVLRIEATFYQEGNNTSTFNVEGLKWE